MQLALILAHWIQWYVITLFYYYIGHYVGGRARFPCGIQSSNTSVFLDGARLPADDPNVMITSDMVVVTSIPSEWNNTALQCKGVSSDGRTELVGLKSRIIVYG